MKREKRGDGEPASENEAEQVSCPNATWLLVGCWFSQIPGCQDHADAGAVYSGTGPPEGFTDDGECNAACLLTSGRSDVGLALVTKGAVHSSALYLTGIWDPWSISEPNKFRKMLEKSLRCVVRRRAEKICQEDEPAPG